MFVCRETDEVDSGVTESSCSSTALQSQHNAESTGEINISLFILEEYSLCLFTFLVNSNFFSKKIKLKSPVTVHHTAANCSPVSELVNFLPKLLLTPN